jgi:hypothetical protein
MVPASFLKLERFTFWQVLLESKTKITAVAQDAAAPVSKTTDAVHRKSVQLTKRKLLKTATAGTALKAAQKVSQ